MVTTYGNISNALKEQTDSKEFIRNNNTTFTFPAAYLYQYFVLNHTINYEIKYLLYVLIKIHLSIILQLTTREMIARIHPYGQNK